MTRRDKMHHNDGLIFRKYRGRERSFCRRTILYSLKYRQHEETSWHGSYSASPSRLKSSEAISNVQQQAHTVIQTLPVTRPNEPDNLASVDELQMLVTEIRRVRDITYPVCICRSITVAVHPTLCQLDHGSKGRTARNGPLAPEPPMSPFHRLAVE